MATGYEEADVEVAVVTAIHGVHLATLHVKPGEGVYQVRDMLHEEFGYPPHSQELLLQGAVAEDDQALEPSPQPLQLALVLSSFNKAEELFQATRHGHTAAVRNLLFRVACDREESSWMLFAVWDTFRETCLHTAARLGHVSVCEALLQAAQSNGEGRGILAVAEVGRFTALHLAAQSGHETVCRTLLAAAATLEERSDVLAARSYTDLTPLHQAASRGHSAACRALLEAAQTAEARREALAARDRGGNTPLHEAARSNHAAACLSLLEAAPSAEVHRMLAAANNDGRTVWQVAGVVSRQLFESM